MEPYFADMEPHFAYMESSENQQETRTSIQEHKTSHLSGIWCMQIAAQVEGVQCVSNNNLLPQ
jgi:hypothetical protein